MLERDKGKALAGHSTLNRLELSAQAIDARYRKIQVHPDELQEFLIKRGVKAIPGKSAEMPVTARWRHCRRSCRAFASGLATRFGSSCAPRQRLCP
jgi:hypothetical protein